MDGFKNSTKTKYSSGDSELIGAAARKVDPKGSVVVGSVKPLYRDRELIGKAARKVDPKGSVMAGDAARYCNGGKVTQATMKKGGMAKKSVTAKKGVPVAPKGPMVGLAAMPKKK